MHADLIQRLEYEAMVLSRHILDSDSRDDDRCLDRSGYLVLSRVQVQGPMTIGELSEAFALDTSTVNRQTAALVRHGLAERIPDPEGGMARKFRITDRGACLLDQERERRMAALRKILSDWTDDDISRFAGYLSRFNGSIELLSGKAWPRHEPALG